jgi:hypothetical protein
VGDVEEVAAVLSTGSVGDKGLSRWWARWCDIRGKEEAKIANEEEAKWWRGSPAVPTRG